MADADGKIRIEKIVNNNKKKKKYKLEKINQIVSLKNFLTKHVYNVVRTTTTTNDLYLNFLKLKEN